MVVESKVRPRTSGAAESPPEKPPFPVWKKVLIGVAGVLVVAGLILLPFERASDSRERLARPAPQEGVQGPEGVGHSLVPGTGGPTIDPEAAGEPAPDPLSPALMRLGFSFFVGLAIGWALRTFLQLALVFVGLLLGALFALEYATWIHVDWVAIEAAFDGLRGRVVQDFESLRSFATGRLPQAGMFALGLMVGFKRR